MPFPIIGALIGAATSIGGAVLSSSSAKKQAKQQFKNDQAAAALQRQYDIADRDEARAYARGSLKRLVEDAEAAGFNPLTVLRNGGAAGYGSADAYAPLSRMNVPVQQATPGLGSFLGQSMSDIGSKILADPYQFDRSEAEIRLVNAQIANLNASTAATQRSQSFNVPTLKGGVLRAARLGVAVRCLNLIDGLMGLWGSLKKAKRL